MNEDRDVDFSLRGIPADVYTALGLLAKDQRTSVNAIILAILQRAPDVARALEARAVLRGESPLDAKPAPLEKEGLL